MCGEREREVCVRERGREREQGEIFREREREREVAVGSDCSSSSLNSLHEYVPSYTSCDCIHCSSEFESYTLGIAWCGI